MQKLLIWALFCLVVAEHKSLADFDFKDSKVPGVDKFQAKVYQDVITEEWELWKAKHGKSFLKEGSRFFWGGDILKQPDPL